jgi:ABC-type antimicrobial peptide transport system permease subunit
MWLSLLPNADRQGIIDQIRDLIPGLISIRDREDVALVSAKNPLTGGGWDGLTALSMGAIGITVLLALSVHALVSVSMGRIDLSVIQVLGFSRLDLFLSLATERLIVAVLAIAAGSAMGYWPGLEILELVDLTPRGDAPVPPLVPSVNRWLMAGALSGLLAASVLSVGFATLAALRLKPSEVVRGGA